MLGCRLYPDSCNLHFLVWQPPLHWQRQTEAAIACFAAAARKGRAQPPSHPSLSISSCPANFCCSSGLTGRCGTPNSDLHQRHQQSVLFPNCKCTFGSNMVKIVPAVINQAYRTTYDLSFFPFTAKTTPGRRFLSLLWQSALGILTVTLRGPPFNLQGGREIFEINNLRQDDKINNL